MNSKKVPNSCELHTSQVKGEMKSFVWVIHGINEIKKLNTWRVPNCQFEAGGFDWNLNLCPSPSGKHLHGLITLVEPQIATIQYFAKFHIVNPQGHLILSSPFVCDHPVVAHGKEENASDQFMWEVLRFNANPISEIENLIFKDTLNLLVEMTVFRDIKGIKGIPQNTNPVTGFQF